MFLTWFDELVNWIKANPDAAKIFSSAIGSVFLVIGGIGGWFSHGVKFKRERRLDARISLFPIINEKLSKLQEKLQKNGRLNTTSFEYGNIYTLYYLKSSRHSFCPSYYEIDSEELESYKRDALDLLKTLSESNNSIHPKVFKKKKWRESKKNVISFCQFIIDIDSAYTGSYDIQCRKGEREPIHIVECKKLVKAIDCVLKQTK